MGWPWPWGGHAVLGVVALGLGGRAGLADPREKREGFGDSGVNDVVGGGEGGNCGGSDKESCGDEGVVILMEEEVMLL